MREGIDVFMYDDTELKSEASEYPKQRENEFGNILDALARMGSRVSIVNIDLGRHPYPGQPPGYISRAFVVGPSGMSPREAYAAYYEACLAEHGLEDTPL